MLPDFGWSELLLIAIVLIVVVGPKDLPRVVRGFSKSLGKLRKTAGEFRKQFDDALADAELDDLKSLASDVKELDPRNKIKDALNPLGAVGKDISDELKGVKNSIEGKDLPDPDIEPPKMVTPEESYPQLAAMRKDIEAENAAKAAAAKKASPKKAAAKKTTTAKKASKPKNTAKANKNAPKTSAKRMTTAKPAKAGATKAAAKPRTTSAQTKADLAAAKKRSAAAKKAAATRARNKAAQGKAGKA